ncbi:OLC1v1037521C1 [Oldenlandia corymbosa var. corymbosa]|uniref:OLC1v1037521C1 n=1 Tax=Oldenlandia corymbosa var. corymbosa TaxID=529605 RepID=A0AAV1E210_OLDCO|nr:OLC1v1037521C1 [Oldenlandia corymbosa var. corymbosa]
MEELSVNEERESVLRDAGTLLETSVENAGFSDRNDNPEGRKEFVAPAIGMEFESYEDAYNYYNCYAREVGFCVRVKNSWFKRNSKEKYGAVLCCSSQGFKRNKHVNHLRKETRTGCPAMIRVTLVDSKRWRIREVTLEHNHLLGLKIHKSIKKSSASKKKVLSNADADIRTVKFYKSLVIDATSNGNSPILALDPRSSTHSDQLTLKKGDPSALQVVEEGVISLDHYKVALQYRNSETKKFMKFKAFLTDHGVSLLEKRILPALDKLGKTCHLYFTKETVYFLHNLLNGDGIQSVAEFKKEALFEDYHISSQNDNRIAFTIDLSLLHRALRSIINVYAEFSSHVIGGPVVNRLQIKLVKKLPAHSQQPSPFLTFETKGYKSAVIQDVPISKPLTRSELAELEAALDSAQEMPKTLVRVKDLNQLDQFVDRMKHVGDVMNVSITKYGDLHLQISTSLITLGAEFRKLLVLGEKADAPGGEGNLSVQTRSGRAIKRGDAMSVQVSVKHFFKSLQCHLAKPDCAFYGITSQGSCLTVIFQFVVPGTRQNDKSISLHCRIPVLDPGSN